MRYNKLLKWLYQLNFVAWNELALSFLGLSLL